ncbi:hypothetical protein BD779DRAFT_1155694 [Infundibulicybe gibba]|nr:hypothetical protein BD779DRAFT_1155694 [Infundibulicybe gibba]
MPPVRDHAVPQDDGADDDMPPLVDNPNPPMMSTFFTDMTPLSYPNTSAPTEPSSSTIPPTTNFSPESTASMTSTPPPSPEDTVVSAQAPITRGSHGKKRDASYIPRPPNAFILFRSSFIRSQQVPGKVEGNHSTLSKIIGVKNLSISPEWALITTCAGMYWKTLPREEREKWEAKAVVAQAEHRRRYPDWRFRPGANAMAKLKVKDGGWSLGGVGPGPRTLQKATRLWRPEGTIWMATTGGQKGQRKGKGKKVQRKREAVCENC